MRHKKSGMDELAIPREGLVPELSSNFELLALRRAHSPPLLEAFPAKYRPPLRGSEGDGSFFPTLRAVGFCFRARLRGVSPAFGALRFAGFTSFGLVLKALVRKEHLLAGGEHELGTALRALPHLVVVVDEPLSPGPVWGRKLGSLCT